jgi:hypothetical protein
MNNQRELDWRTSSKSGGANCVEVAPHGDQVYLRDSKDPSGAVLAFDRRAFKDFIAHVSQAAVTDRR